MKKLNKTIAFLLLMFSLMSVNTFASSFLPVDSMKVLEQYSLFSEYHKNKDYVSALPYGWKVLELDPVKFAKYYYFKMEETLWFIHDSSDVSEELVTMVNDSIVGFYDNAITYYADEKGYFQVRKAFVKEVWLNADPNDIIMDYEEAFKSKPDLSSYYYHRLGQLFVANAADDNDFKSKALDLYSFLSERESDNPQWVSELENLAENIDELVQLTKRTWDLDKENTQKAWKFASMAIRASNYEAAIEPLEFLVVKSPESVNYWNQLAMCYQKLDKLGKAEDAFKKLIELEPSAKEHYMNLGIIYKDMGRLSQARTQYQKASDVGNGWALPIFYEGLLYEQSARGCTFDFETKLVYKLAVDTYRKARNMDPSLNQAQDRMNALSSSLPIQEDYFFRGYKSGQVLPINGSCFGWIGRSVTVP